MNVQERDQKVLQIYAALGELSVRRKQILQTLKQLDDNIEHFEKQLLEVLKAPTVKEPEVVDNVRPINPDNEKA